MLIDPKLRQRILISLRWLCRDAQWRFNEVKGNLDNGSNRGGYSPELTEATQLLQDLEQGTMFVGAEEPRLIAYSEQACIDMGNRLGMKEGDAVAFFLKYGTQGWLLGNGLPIVDLCLAMRKWKLMQESGYTFEKKQQPGTQAEYDKLKQDGDL